MPSANPAGGLDPPDLETLNQELLNMASIADPTERLLEVAAVIAEALSDLDVQPVVVGGRGRMG